MSVCVRMCVCMSIYAERGGLPVLVCMCVCERESVCERAREKEREREKEKERERVEERERTHERQKTRVTMGWL